MSHLSPRRKEAAMKRNRDKTLKMSKLVDCKIASGKRDITAIVAQMQAFTANERSW